MERNKRPIAARPPLPVYDLHAVDLRRRTQVGESLGNQIDELKANNIKISMGGNGRWMDNVFIERLWRSLKYVCVYLNAFDNMNDAEENISYCMDYYNHEPAPRFSKTLSKAGRMATTGEHTAEVLNAI